MRHPRIAPADMPIDESPRTLAEVLAWRARHHGDRLALTYLADGQAEATRLTYGEIATLARRIAAQLQQRSARSQAVILLFEPGPEFLVAFLACLLAGARGVPLYPPDVKRLARTLPRFLAIVEDCEADLILTTRKMKAMGSAVFEVAPQLARRTWLAVDEAPAGLEEAFRAPDVAPDEVAFLQYTSGSTGDPKGVEVSHRGLMLNFGLLDRQWGSRAGETMVTWLPNYHDMGLIDGWLRPIHTGCHCVAMPPVAFLKRPLSWLEAISRYRGAVSGGPNFAYEVCVAKITDDELRGLDLRSWRVAYDGAEPVRAETVRRFTERFAACGFRPTAFSPGYGLAEATLAVSASTFDALPSVLPVRRAALERFDVEVVRPEDPDALLAVGSGKPMMEVCIVDPDTRVPCPPDRMGEIWVAGPTLALGYLNRPELSRDVFQARLADAGSGEAARGPFLRTGDLGFLGPDGELFIGGRRKDLIILRGRNHYPQDVEQTVEAAAPAAFRPGCNAAFSIEADGEERLVIVQEVQRRGRDVAPEHAERRTPDPAVEAFAPHLDVAPRMDDVMRSVRAAVIDAHGIDPYRVVLLKAGSIPKTSSGKIQRRACREGLLKGTLEIVATWEQPRRADAPPATIARETKAREDGGQSAGAKASQGREEPPTSPTTPAHGKTAEAIRDWLRSALAARFQLPIADVGEHRPFAELGLDSREGTALVGELERWLGTSLPVAVIYDHPTADALARHLAGEAPSAIAAPAAEIHEPIAIVGIGCRLPGASGPDALARLLRDGVHAVREIPADRWDVAAFHDDDPATPGKTISRHGGFLDGIDDFDPRAFDLSPREAARMDPQQRLLLEVAVEALESAGIPPKALGGSATGVFVGISSYDHGRLLFADPGAIDAYAGTGGALSIAANRVSYHLDLHGPSLAVDTACSSSLVAVHLAVAALRRGECDVALAGGVNAVLLPDVHLTFTKAGVLSPEGRCKAFDAGADGIVRSEGAAVVVLKPLSRAVADGDPIWAVILGSAVNSDGRSNGLMAPNGTAQQQVLAAAYRDAGVAPDRVDYVEAHGTGTALGDPVEVGALARVVSVDRPAERPCRIGSLKTNLGHLEAAAGIAGLIKVALSLHHRELWPSLHFDAPNPRIAFEALRVQVQTKREPWPAAPGEGLAGVSAFGFGGTNAHVVLGEAPREAMGDARGVEGEPQLVGFSARSAAGLRALAEDAGRFVAEHGAQIGLPRIAWSSMVRRHHAAHRLAIAARTTDDLREQLAAFVAGDPRVAAGEVLPEASRKVAFVFPGQGGQWWAMGRDLLATDAVFRAALERCDRLFEPLAGWSLIAELHRDRESTRVHATEHTQPLLFAVQAGLAEVWRASGVAPSVVVGHSMGELTAAYVAGKLTLEEALRIALHRGRIMALARGTGTMIAVALPFEEAEALAARFPGRLALAVNNAPGSCVLSGAHEAAAEVLAMLAARGVFARELHVEVAGHGPDMDRLAPMLAEAAGPVPDRPSAVPIVSTVTGERADGLAFDGAYWARNLREPVRFRRAMETLLAEGVRVFLELGPHPVLQEAIAENAAHAAVTAIPLGSMKRDADAKETLLRSAATLHTLGVPLDLARLCPRPGRCAPLPTTPWDHERCALGRPAERAALPPSRAGHPLLDQHTESPSEPGVHHHEVKLSLDTHAWIADHRVEDQPVLPATAYLELLRACCRQAFGEGPYPLANVAFHRAMLVGATGSRTVHTTLKPGEEGRIQLEVWSRPDAASPAPWTRHASAEVDFGATHLAALDLPALEARCPEIVSPSDHYAAFAARSIDYRGAFHSVVSVHRGHHEALGRIALPAATPHEDARGRFDIHPGLLDACLQVMGAALPVEGPDAHRTYMPVRVERIALQRPPPGVVTSHVTLRDPDPAQPDSHTSDVRLGDANGRLWGEVRGLEVRRVDRGEIAARADAGGWLYQVAWEPKPPVPADQEAPTEGGWLLLADRGGHAAELARRLRAKGRPCWLVTCKLPRTGPTAAVASPNGAKNKPEYDIDPSDPAALRDVLERCCGSTTPVARVVDLWPLDAPGPETLAEDPGEAAEQLLATEAALCGGVVHLVQALAARSFREPPRLWIVTRGAQPQLASAEAPAIAQAPLWGLGRSIAHEHPALWGGLVDLDGATPMATLLAEIDRPDREDQIAFREGRRFVPRLVRSPHPAATPHPRAKASRSSDANPLGATDALPGSADDATALHCSADATYLVTGGLGALGLRVARWLVQRGARHLLLTGRTPFVERPAWEDAAAHGDERAAAALDLERSGARIFVATADAADLAAMRRALATPGLPPVRGVVHAAGIVVPRPITDVRLADLVAELRPKIAGAWILHRLLRDEPLDFFVAFSSASAIWGSKLLAGYGAANHFLDALAHLRRREGAPALAVDWAMWGEAGMAAQDDHRRLLLRMGLRPMSPEPALAALEALLLARTTQATVADVDWSILAPLQAQHPRRRLLERLHPTHAGRAPEAAAAKPEAAAALLEALRADPDPDARRGRLLDLVLTTLAGVLGAPRAKLLPDASLPAQGLDSLSAGDLRARLQRALPVQVSALALLGGDSPRRIAAGLLDQLAPHLGAPAPHAPRTNAPSARAASLGAPSTGEASPGPVPPRPEPARPEDEVLPPDIRPDRAEPMRRASPRAVLLTGATGFLGTFALAQLCRRTDAAIHCLVKAPDDAAAMGRLRRSLAAAGLWQAGMERRIVPVAGDLASPRLGLSPTRWDALATGVDQILHAGYAVNFLFSYEDLRPANVLGTLEIVRLASAVRRKPLHFVSSLSVLLTPEYADSPVDEDSPLHPAEGAYREGKRASERLLAEARALGLPVSVYRPPFIGWHSATGHFNERDFLIRLLRGCLSLGAAPDLDAVFYIAPVDWVAAALVHLTQDAGALGRTYNLLAAPRGIAWSELVDLVRRAGGRLAMEPLEAWRARLAQADASNPLHVFFPPPRPGVEDSGAAVMELFQRRAAPSRIGRAATLERLGPPPVSTTLDEGLVRVFLERLRRAEEVERS